jgi:threonine dehydratase
LSYRCVGCDATARAGLLPFQCPNRFEGDDREHVLIPEVPPSLPGVRDSVHPFLRFQDLFFAFHLLGESPEERGFDSLVSRLDREIAGSEGMGFRETPLRRDARLSKMFGFTAKGGIWVKDETAHVGGSHKARHLFGILLAIEAAQIDRNAPLAIASCGNAALAAAALARAAKRVLQVFVPEEANEKVVERLREEGARVDVCRREAPGDPSVRRFREAVREGAVPFTVQGPENALAIEGGETLGLETLAAAAHRGVRFDRVFVQVGGGALAASWARAAHHACASGWIDRASRLHPVQTEGCHPLELAHRALLRRAAGGESIAGAVRYAAMHRSEFMKPWKSPGRSLASGILDDETYDWLETLEGVLESNGSPVVVSEKEIMEANDLASESQRSLGLREVSFTGSAGLAGLLRLRRENRVAASENALVLFTGARHNESE